MAAAATVVPDGVIEPPSQVRPPAGGPPDTGAGHGLTVPAGMMPAPAAVKPLPLMGFPPRFLSYAASAAHSQLTLVAYVRDQGFPGGRIWMGVLSSVCFALALIGLGLGLFYVGIPKPFHLFLILASLTLKGVVLGFTWVHVRPSLLMFVLGISANIGSFVGVYLAARKHIPEEKITTINQAIAVVNTAFLLKRYQDVVTQLASAEATFDTGELEYFKAVTQPILIRAREKLEKEEVRATEAANYIEALKERYQDCAQAAEKYYCRITSETNRVLGVAHRMLS